MVTAKYDFGEKTMRTLYHSESELCNYYEYRFLACLTMEDNEIWSCDVG